MTKGTTSSGGRHTKSHTLCIRCGRRAFHCQKKRCASCGYPDAKIRKFKWAPKAHRRHTTGTGRCRYLKQVAKKIHCNFREGCEAKPAYKAKEEN